MTPEDLGDRGRGQPLAPKQAERVPFGEGDLVIRHGSLPSFGRELKTTVFQVTFLVAGHCCTSYMNPPFLTPLCTRQALSF